MSNDSLPRSADDSPLPHEDDHPELAASNARAGLVLFAVYLVLYGSDNL